MPKDFSLVSLRHEGQEIHRDVYVKVQSSQVRAVIRLAMTLTSSWLSVVVLLLVDCIKAASTIFLCRGSKLPLMMKDLTTEGGGRRCRHEQRRRSYCHDFGGRCGVGRFVRGILVLFHLIISWQSLEDRERLPVVMRTASHLLRRWWWWGA